MHATIIMEGRLVNDPEHKTGKNGDYCICLHRVSLLVISGIAMCAISH